METNMQHIQPADQTVSAIIGQLKFQGIFDEFRRDCIADVDTKPAYQNLRQRVEIYVSKFLSQQTWCTDLNKNQLRDSLRRSINESGVLAWGIDHLVDQIVTPKIYNVFYPQIETVVKEYLGLENRIFLPDLSVPPPGMGEMLERNIDQRPPEPREEIKSNIELQLNDGNKAPTICNAGVGEQYNISESSQTFVDMLVKTSSEAVDKVGVKLEERPNSPIESREENTEGTKILKVKSEIPDISDVPMKTDSETKVHCLDEQKKSSTEKKLEQDAHSSVIEKSKNTKEKDKDGKFRRERSASECSDRETQKYVGEKKDHIKTSAHKKSGIDSVKYDKEKKLDKHKTTEKEKLKSDAVKSKDLKKHESEKVEKKLVQKSDPGKSGSDSSKLKHAKTTDMQKKGHKYDGSHSKSSTHNTDSLKCNKPDEKSKVDSNVKVQKFSEHKSFNKLDKTDKSKTVKSDMKGKADQDSSKPRSDSKQKSFDGSSLKLNKHASENKPKHLDSKAKSHGTQENSPGKQIAEKKSHTLSSSQKSESADKIRHAISDKKHLERTKSTESSEDPLRSEYPEAKRIKLDHASTSGYKKSDKYSTNYSHSKHSSEKERKSDSSKDNNRNKTHYDKQKISKVSEKPRHSHPERNSDDTSSKTNGEKSTERKSSSSSEKQKSSNDKLKLPSSSDKQQQSSSSDKHRKAEEYRLLKEKAKRKEKSGEMKHEKYSKKVKPVREESSRTSSEGSSKSKDDTIKTKDDIDYLSSVSQKWKIHQSQESSNSKDCVKQSPCCNFSPEACSESESHSSKGSDILLNIRPVLGISPSQESCFESINDSEKTKLTSEIISHPKEPDGIIEHQTRISSDEKEDTSKITQDGKDGCISRLLLNDDDEDGVWSDVTISSVHTSDLSSFDDRISLSSSEEVEEENSQKEKKKVPLKEIKKLTESHEISIDKEHGDTSFSEDEKTKHKTELSRKRTSSEKSNSSNFSRCFESIGGKREEVPSAEPKVEHKWELRRQRKINPRYTSDEFSSIFNSSKWSYSNNLDIGDSDTCEPVDKVPVRKNSQGSRSDMSLQADSDSGISRSGNIDKSDRRRKRSRARTSESEQGEKGPSVKRQKHKEEIKSETKRQNNDFRDEGDVTDEYDLRNKTSNKRTNVKSLGKENDSLPYKDNAFITDIQVEKEKGNKRCVTNVDNSEIRHKCSKRINFKFLEENDSSVYKDNASSVITTDLREKEKCNRRKEDESVTNDSNIKDKCKRTSLEQENSPPYDDSYPSVASNVNIESAKSHLDSNKKRKGTNVTDDSEVIDAVNKQTNLELLEKENSSSYIDEAYSPIASTTNIQSEKSHLEIDKSNERKENESFTDNSQSNDKSSKRTNLQTLEKEVNFVTQKDNSCSFSSTTETETEKPHSHSNSGTINITNDSEISDKSNRRTNLEFLEETGSQYKDETCHVVASITDDQAEKLHSHSNKGTTNTTDDSKVIDKSKKKLNLQCLEAENNSSLPKDDASPVVASTTDIQSKTLHSEVEISKSTP